MFVSLTGVGYKKDHSDNWIAHQDDFNAILANLNEGNSEQQATVSSIESASKKSRSRVQSVLASQYKNTIIMMLIRNDPTMSEK